MDNSKVILFVITDDTRSLTTMILAAYYIGLGRDVVLCVEPLSESEAMVRNEKVRFFFVIICGGRFHYIYFGFQIVDICVYFLQLTIQAVKDYNRGRVYLSDLAKRKQVSVFDNITKAVQRAIDLCCGNR